MSDIASFLAARYAEEWAAARDRELAAGLGTSRETRDVDAKRAILARYADCLHPGYSAAEAREYDEFVLPTLVSVYSDHPEFDKGWRP